MHFTFTDQCDAIYLLWFMIIKCDIGKAICSLYHLKSVCHLLNLTQSNQIQSSSQLNYDYMMVAIYYATQLCFTGMMERKIINIYFQWHIFPWSIFFLPLYLYLIYVMLCEVIYSASIILHVFVNVLPFALARSQHCVSC